MLELIPDLTQAAGWLPLVFALVMALAMLAYVILDGYDLGVGVLLRRADDADQKDTMIDQRLHDISIRSGFSPTPMLQVDCSAVSKDFA